MPYKINDRETFRCLRLFVVVFEVELLTSTSIYPLSSSLICTPHHPSPGLSNQINLSPSVGQSHHIQTSRRGEEGDWRRRDHLRDISLSDGQPSWSITRSGEKVTGLLPLVSYLSWILFMTAGPWNMTVLRSNGLKEPAYLVLTLLSL